MYYKDSKRLFKLINAAYPPKFGRVGFFCLRGRFEYVQNKQD
jgi:hypothetical protein